MRTHNRCLTLFCPQSKKENGREGGGGEGRLSAHPGMTSVIQFNQTSGP